MDLLDGIEALLYGGVALVLIAGAWYVSLRILLASFGVAGPVALIVWTAAVFAFVVRDVIQRRWSPVSVGALLVFLLSICIVIAAEFQWSISSSG